MIESHWDGIGAFCKPENKVALGFVGRGFGRAHGGGVGSQPM